MEPLMEIPRENWRKLCELIEVSDWPLGAPTHCMLEFVLAYPLLAQDFDVHVYCPEGILTNGIVATSLMNGYYQVIIQPIGNNQEKIKTALRSTKIIDWNKVTTVPYASSVTIECLESIKDELGIYLFYGTQTKAYIHYLDKTSVKFDQVQPTNTYFGILRPEHIDIVDKSWTYHSKSSFKIFEILRSYNLSYVLYSKTESEIENEEKNDGIDCTHQEFAKKVTETTLDESKSVLRLESNFFIQSLDKEKEKKEIEAHSDQPLAWLSVNEHGTLSHLFTREQHRKKGYGEAITKHVANKLLSNGHNVIAYTTENNIGPKRLFKKLGFEDIGHVFWVMVYKKPVTN